MGSFFIGLSPFELRKVLRSCSIWPHSESGFVVLSTNRPGFGPYIEFNSSIHKLFDSVEVSSSWFESHRPQAVFLVQDWESEFQLPDFLAKPPAYLSDEAMLSWKPDPSILDRVQKGAQLAFFLKNPTQSVIISREPGQSVTFDSSDVKKIALDDPALLGEFVDEYPEFPYEFI